VFEWVFFALGVERFSPNHGKHTRLQFVNVKWFHEILIGS